MNTRRSKVSPSARITRPGRKSAFNACQNSAFTLIELLVVIAIIAILAAILFPVFAQAREKARQTTCISNLKQLGLGIMQYTQDYDETYPISSYFGTTNPPSTSLAASLPWLSWAGIIYPYVKSAQVFQCPDAPANLGTTLGTWVDAYSPNGFPVSYAYNYSMGGSATGNGTTIPTIKALAVVQSPANLVMIVESGADPTGTSKTTNNPADPTTWTTSQSSTFYNYHASSKYRTEYLLVGAGSSLAALIDSGGPVPRHNGRADVLWADGHVKSTPVAGPSTTNPGAKGFYTLYKQEVPNKPADVTTTYWSPCLDPAYGCSYQ